MSMDAATAEARAAQSMGKAVQGLGAIGFDLATKARRADEAKEVSKFLLGLDAEAAEFSNDVMSRADTAKWGDEWQSKVSSAREQFDNLNLSQEAKDNLGLRFDGWASSTTIRLEGQVALKNLQEAKAQIAVGVDYHLKRGEFDKAREQAGLLKGVGVGEAEQTKVYNEIDRGEALFITEEDIEVNPSGTKEVIEDPSWIENNPGVTLEDQKRMANQADRVQQEKRGTRMDALEARYLDGTIQVTDIENARASGEITELDELKWKKTLTDAQPPTDEKVMEAWGILDDLRALRDAPTTSQNDYIKAHNQARAHVLGLVPPNYQGDLKRELNYLTPAGRLPGGGSAGGFRIEDKRSVGRSVIQGALSVGDLGDIEEPKSKAAANTRAAKLNAELNRWLETKEGQEASTEDIEWKAADLILADKTTAAAGKMSGSVPGGGRRLAPELPRPQRSNQPRMSADLLPGLEERTK